jgi:hypothetical protein
MPKRDSSQDRNSTFRMLIWMYRIQPVDHSLIPNTVDLGDYSDYFHGVQMITKSEKPEISNR